MIVTIKKNKHSFFKLPHFTLKKKIILDFKLKGDFTYICDDIKNQKDTNKIFGISDSYYHRRDSIRIGFRYINDNIELLAYYYNKGKHYAEKIDNIQCDKEYNLEIYISDKNYHIKYNFNEYIYPRTSKWFFMRYLLFPYFGGEERAKKDLTFKINYKLH